MTGDETSFHEVAIVTGIWVLALFVGMHSMVMMRTVLVPLFWAFFLMMVLVPATDVVERGLNVCCLMATRKVKSTGRYSNLEAGLEHQADDFDDDDEEGTSITNCGQDIIRTVAVVLVAVSFFGGCALFGFMIYVSALHMQDNWANYEEGAKRLSRSFDYCLTLLAKAVPKAVMDNALQKGFAAVEEMMSYGVSYIVDSISGGLVEGLMMLLYMMFWLCQPMHVGENVSVLFRQYIMLKAIASAGYAFCVWVVLHLLGIDLAIVFGLITFLFNFVPEVGPLFAIILPIPVVLFDARLDHPAIVLTIGLTSNLLLKCLWANIIEVKLVERQREMRMHPVVILFFVAFFGWIWGPTGMLLSVPAVSVVKASMHLFPSKYRDPILILLEGDQRAPARYRKWRAETMKTPPSFGSPRERSS